MFTEYIRKGSFFPQDNVLCYTTVNTIDSIRIHTISSKRNTRCVFTRVQQQTLSNPETVLHTRLATLCFTRKLSTICTLVDVLDLSEYPLNDKMLIRSLPATQNAKKAVPSLYKGHGKLVLPNIRQFYQKVRFWCHK